MAGLFGLFNYSKPGKGVDIDEPPKHPFFLFFELYWRKFTKLIALNLLFFLFFFPILVYLYLQLEGLIRTYIPALYQDIVSEAVEAGQEPIRVLSMLQTILFSITSLLPDWANLTLLIASVALYGPMSCGFTYILRNYARQEHAWLSDFFTQMKKNFVQGVIAGLLEIGLFVLLLYNILLQPGEGITEGMALLLNIVKYLSVFLFVLLLFVRNYIYIMVVTFDMKLRQMLKNSLIFSVLGLFRNILVAVVSVAFFVAVLLVPYADIILIPFFAFSFCGFLSVFACWPIIYKYMIQPTLPETGDKNGDGEQEAAADPVQRVDPRLLGGE